MPYFQSSPVVAEQSDQETASSTTTYVSPGRQHFHPSAAKGWVMFQGTGTVSILASYNVASIDDEAMGHWQVNIATDFSSANYCAISGCGGSGETTPNVYAITHSFAAGNYDILTGVGGASFDCEHVTSVFFGDI